MIKGATGGGKGKKGWVELQDDGVGVTSSNSSGAAGGGSGGSTAQLPAAAGAAALAADDHLEEVSLGGSGGPAWLAGVQGVRRGSSDETAPSSMGTSPSDEDLYHPHPHPTPADGRTERRLLPPPGVAAANNAKMGVFAMDPATAKGAAWLSLALLLASMNPAVLSGLMYKSAAARDFVYTPVSILGAGSLLGLLVAVRAFWRDLLKAGSLSRYEWAFLLLTAMAGPCLSSFYLVDGLRLTSVPIAAVLSRLDAAFLLAFATLVYGTAQSIAPTPTAPTTTTEEEEGSSSSQQPTNTKRRLVWSGANALLLVLAALLAAFTRDPRLPVEEGDYAPVVNDGSDRLPSPKGAAFLVLGALLAAITQLSTRQALQRVPLGLLIVTRLALAFLLFHPMALAYGGLPALRAIYHPRLWLTMLWYAPVFIWALEFAWLKALKACPAPWVAYGLTALLVFELLWARILLRQPLTFGESIAAGLVLTATLSALTERWYRGTPQAWTEEDEGAPAPEPAVSTSTSSKPLGDLEEAKEEVPSSSSLPPAITPAAVVNSITRRRFVDTAGVAPGREVTLRHHYV